MPSPPIQVFLTTITSQISLRQRQEYILRILQVRKIAFTPYDLASDEAAKKLWRRKAPLDKQQLPGILVGGKFPGTFAEFEEAAENDELSIFLRLDEPWDEETDGDHPAPPVQPVGVPGASLPSQMTNHQPSFAASSSPLASKKKGGSKQLDLGNELEGFGLQGVKVTDDELLELVEELGLGGKEASELVEGLSGVEGGVKTEIAPGAHANPDSTHEGKEIAKEAIAKQKDKEARSTRDSDGLEVPGPT